MPADRHPEPTAPIHGERFLDPRFLARSLYWRGWGVTELTAELNKLHGLALNASTVASWKTRDKWDEAPTIVRCESATEARYCQLVAKETKTGQDFKEIDLLGRQIERLARVRRYQAPGGNEVDLNPAIAARNAGAKKKPTKNHLTEDQVEQLVADFGRKLFEYQNDWRNSSSLRTRFLLKSRQIGATWYFAREALVRCFETGNNQIFISASRAQANIFRQYIIAWVQSVTGVKLEGDPIVLDVDGLQNEDGEQPTLYFLGTNYRTAQGYHGDVYVDEGFWIYGFEELWKVASAMALQKRFRKTIISTPSTRGHEAYKLWSGDRFNARRAKNERAEFDISHEHLKGGRVGPDRIWRQIVTIHDAEAKGCDLFDIDELRIEYSADEFDNLLLCQFIDDSQSMFPYALVRRCMVDSWEAWSADFDPYALRPYGDGEVWIGYDPDESAAGDNAALVVVAAPRHAKDKFRVLAKYRTKGLGFQEQAEKILEQLEKYNVTYIGIDTTGVGASVWQLVVKRFPTAKRIDYSVPVKTQMVLKAKSVMQAGRLEFDAGANDIAASFMAIQAELTKSQRQVTYVASRAGETGHADLAWAVMHALANEPLDPADTSTRKAKVRTFGHGNGRDDPAAADERRARRKRRDDRGNGHSEPHLSLGGDGTRTWGARVSLRRRRSGARSARPADVRRVLVQRSMVRAAHPDVRPSARLSRHRASFERDPVQTGPAGRHVRTDALARSA